MDNFTSNLGFICCEIHLLLNLSATDLRVEMRLYAHLSRRVILALSYGLFAICLVTLVNHLFYIHLIVAKLLL